MYFLGLDPGQKNQGIALIDENDRVIVLEDTGRDFPDELVGRDIPDILKNAYQYEVLDRVISQHKSENIVMTVMEGPNYSSSANVTQISIGSIHGQNQIYCFTHKMNFAILTPKSINYAIFGTAKEITKSMTKEEMKKRFPHIGGRLSSNMTDALAMAYLARQLYFLINGGTTLSKGEQEIFLSKKDYKGHPKGLVYNVNNKLFLFDDKGDRIKNFKIKEEI